MSCYLYLQVAIVIMALALGMWYVRQPEKVIKMQKVFYGLFNWRIEPISLTKEIRNTRIMGATVIILGIISLISIILRR